MQKNVIEDVFGTKVFNDDVMQEYLPKKTYAQLRDTIENGEELAPEVANVVERMGIEKRCYSLYPLVPANDRCNSRKT